jgi:adenosylhomocysteine nucleosidase
VNYALLFALEREAAAFLRRHRAAIVNHGWPDPPPCAVRRLRLRARTLTVLITGVGFDRARSAIEWLLVDQGPDLVVAAGFAGALDPGLAVGDVIVGSEVVETDGEHWRTVLPAELGDRECGRVLTARQMITSPATKRRLHRDTRAVAVDMESAAIAEACQAGRIPCAVIRAISDAADTTLSPQLLSLLCDDRISPRRVLTALIRRPLIAAEFWRLARATRLAAENLADALDEMMA